MNANENFDDSSGFDCYDEDSIVDSDDEEPIPTTIAGQCRAFTLEYCILANMIVAWIDLLVKTSVNKISCLAYMCRTAKKLLKKYPLVEELRDQKNGRNQFKNSWNLEVKSYVPPKLARLVKIDPNYLPAELMMLAQQGRDIPRVVLPLSEMDNSDASTVATGATTPSVASLTRRMSRAGIGASYERSHYNHASNDRHNKSTHIPFVAPRTPKKRSRANDFMSESFEETNTDAFDLPVMKAETKDDVLNLQLEGQPSIAERLAPMGMIRATTHSDGIIAEPNNRGRINMARNDWDTFNRNKPFVKEVCRSHEATLGQLESSLSHGIEEEEANLKQLKSENQEREARVMARIARKKSQLESVCAKVLILGEVKEEFESACHRAAALRIVLDEESRNPVNPNFIKMATEVHKHLPPGDNAKKHLPDQVNALFASRATAKIGNFLGIDITVGRCDNTVATAITGGSEQYTGKPDVAGHHDDATAIAKAVRAGKEHTKMAAASKPPFALPTVTETAPSTDSLPDLTLGSDMDAPSAPFSVGSSKAEDGATAQDLKPLVPEKSKITSFFPKKKNDGKNNSVPNSKDGPGTKRGDDVESVTTGGSQDLYKKANK